MKVRIGEIIIPDAEVKRFIDLQSELPLSMIKVSYIGEAFKELGKAFQEHTLLPFECDIIKTQVLVHGASHNFKEKKHEYILLERAADVSAGYKLIHTKVGNEKAIIVPENTKDMRPEEMQKLRNLPYIRFILKKDIPADLLES
jgi:hypothetical protein